MSKQESDAAQKVAEDDEPDDWYVQRFLFPTDPRARPRHSAFVFRDDTQRRSKERRGKTIAFEYSTPLGQLSRSWLTLAQGQAHLQHWLRRYDTTAFPRDAVRRQ